MRVRFYTWPLFLANTPVRTRPAQRAPSAPALTTLSDRLLIFAVPHCRLYRVCFNNCVENQSARRVSRACVVGSRVKDFALSAGADVVLAEPPHGPVVA